MSIVQKRLVVFDIGNVLLKFSYDRVRRNFNCFEKGLGNDLVPAMLQPSLAFRLEEGKISGHRYYDLLKKKIGFTVSYKQFCDGFNNIFTPIKANFCLLKLLSKKHPVALLSNTNEIHWKYILKNYPLLKKARWPFSSHLLKAMKPDSKIYKRLSQKTGFYFNEMVYVDDRSDLIRAAQKLNITTIHYTGKESLRKQFKKVGIQ